MFPPLWWALDSSASPATPRHTWNVWSASQLISCHFQISKSVEKQMQMVDSPLWTSFLSRILVPQVIAALVSLQPWYLSSGFKQIFLCVNICVCVFCLSITAGGLIWNKPMRHCLKLKLEFLLDTWIWKWSKSSIGVLYMFHMCVWKQKIQEILMKPAFRETGDCSLGEQRKKP